jgi:uncharacterized protein (DUF433 family)
VGSWVEVDGVAFIAGTPMTVAQIVQESTFLSYSPTDILDSHPFLTITQINGALDYYAANKQAVDIQITEETALLDQLEAQNPTSFPAELLAAR